MHKPVIIITRTQPGASRTASSITMLGAKVIIVPLLQIEPIIPPPELALTDGTHLIFTSAHAVSIFAEREQRRYFPLWCVGEGTADIATTYGFKYINAGCGDARALGNKIIAALTPNDGPLLHLANSAAKHNLTNRLKRANFDAQTQFVYHSTIRQAAEAEILQVLCQIADTQMSGNGKTMILLHSPKAAQILANIYTKSKIPSLFANIIAVTLSKNVAIPLHNLPFYKICIAKNPTESALLNCITKLL